MTIKRKTAIWPVPAWVGVGILLAAFIPCVGYAQGAISTNDLVKDLSGLETTQNINVAALRRAAIERIKQNDYSDPTNRPPIAAMLSKLPQLTVEIQFNLDSAIIKSNSYPTLGRIADALYHPYLLGYRFLIVGHTDSTGRREYNLDLSQKRANAVRQVLVTTFRIPAQRFLTVGLGEEQLRDAQNPKSATNRRVQIITVGKANH